MQLGFTTDPLFVQQITFILVLFFYLSSKLQFYFFVLFVRKSRFLCKFARVQLYIGKI